MYIHISNQYKTSEDLEIYELEYSDNKYLQEVCDVKQPSVFNYRNVYPEFFDKINSESIEDVGVYDVKVKDTQDYWVDNSVIDYVVMPLQSSLSLMKTDTHSNYISEDNDTFIEDAGLFKYFKENDLFLRPSMTVQTKYDIMFGSQKSTMPFRFHKHCRYFVSVHSGKARIKLTPWKSCKYLYPIHDYDCFEFRSPINIWKPQRKYFHEMDKMKFLEFDIAEGQMLYIPPYWWYSIQYLDSSNVLCGITYDNVISTLANAKDTGLYLLQQSNTKTKITKTIDIPATATESIDEGATESNITATTTDNSENIENDIVKSSI
jgi:hypothetical protein